MTTLTQTETTTGVMQRVGEQHTDECSSLHDGIVAFPVDAMSQLDPIVSDGKGGWFLRPSHMADGYPYVLIVNAMPLIAVKGKDAAITFYGLPE